MHIYIHWPFCKNKCHYCDFVAFEKHEEFITQYHRALCNELSLYASKDKKIKTIFFGGGTPSLYPLHLLEELFEIISKFDCSSLEEVSLEVNPGGIFEKHLQTWRRLGINRLSIGVQVLDDKVLSNLNRMQTNQDVYDLMEIVPKYFDNFSIDLILGLPNVTEEIWKNTLEQAVLWPLSHMSIYMLMVHKKTPLYFRSKKGELKIDDDDKVARMYKETVKFVESNGLVQYETSNFAKPGFESIHNKAYWDHRPYKGFGLGAVSFDGVSRTSNIKNLPNYLKAYSQPSEFTYHSVEKLTDKQLSVERLMLGLRQRSGVDLHSVLYLKEVGDQEELLAHIESLKSQGLVIVDNKRLILTLEGMALENEVVLSLI